MASLSEVYGKSRRYHLEERARLWHVPPTMPRRLAHANEHEVDQRSGAYIADRLQNQDYVDNSAFVRPVRGLDGGQIANGENYLRLYTTYTTAPGDLDYNWMRQASHNQMHMYKY